MDLTHKQKVLIAVGTLIVAFIGIVAWYLFVSPKAFAPTAEVSPTATTTLTATPQGPSHITENAAYYDIDLTYPSVTPLASVSAKANENAVAQMRLEMQNIAAKFKENGNFANLSHDDIQIIGLDQRKYALGSEYKTYTGTRTVSYVFEIYEDTLGAHPNVYSRTFTYDTRTGAQVTLKDLFLPSIPYLERVSNRVRSDLPGIIRDISGFEGDPSMITSGTTPTTENFAWFYVSGKNLVLIFPPYQVGPYALGTVTDTIPLAQFADSLRAEYSK